MNHKNGVSLALTNKMYFHPIVVGVIMFNFRSSLCSNGYCEGKKKNIKKKYWTLSERHLSLSRLMVHFAIFAFFASVYRAFLSNIEILPGLPLCQGEAAGTFFELP
tara:strand:- start:1461 stop:1778 length:318 start_codon:yes stop_codon:yes gene_type:complete